MSGPRRPGMDHDIYPYAPIGKRSHFVPPGGGGLVFTVLLHLEYWEPEPPPGSWRDPRFRNPFGNFEPDYQSWSYREYGARVGIFRVLDVLERRGIRASVAVNATAAERYRPVVAALRAAGHEPVAHGISATQMITARMDAAAERAHIADARDRLAAVWGALPVGWHGQDYGATARTSRLLAELGFSYTLDWNNDELPYWHNLDRSLLALPGQAEWDDVQALWLRRVPVTRFPDLVGDAADRLLAEAAAGRGARVLGIGLHPWMIGAPHRIRYLGEALDRVVGRDGVRVATAGELAQWWRAADDAVQLEAGS